MIPDAGIVSTQAQTMRPATPQRTAETRRRVWVRAVPAGPGTTRVELAGLALQGKPAFEGELARLAAQVERGSGGLKPGPPEDRGTLNDAKDHAAAEETRP